MARALAGSESRPWGRAMAWLLFLGPFFFASYGFANWLASRRDGVGAIAYAWERGIPFVPWTIVPYWSIDFLYAVSIFVCATRRELDRHAQRLLLVQLVSVTCFIAFPLRFSFERPEAEGLFGALFAALGSFDKPFNQVPSLHISLLVVIWVRLAAHLGPRMRWVLHGWMTLIALSILTTFQHHFIDLPTGLAVGLAALWVLPDEGLSPLRRLLLTSDRTRRRLAAFYAAGAILLVIVAFAGGVWLWLTWPATALLLVAMNYAFIGARGFQKGSDGRLSIGAAWLLAPYTAAAWLNSRIWTRNHPLPVEVIDGVWIGRVPFQGAGRRGLDQGAGRRAQGAGDREQDSVLQPLPPAPRPLRPELDDEGAGRRAQGAGDGDHDSVLQPLPPAPRPLRPELDDQGAGRRAQGAGDGDHDSVLQPLPPAPRPPRPGAIVDLSAELPCRAGSSYCSIPVLDLTVPDRASLETAVEAIEEARQRGPVLVCCALGYSRSAAAVVAWLLKTRRADSVGAATAIVKAARPSIVLKGEHHAALEGFA